MSGKITRILSLTSLLPLLFLFLLPHISYSQMPAGLVAWYPFNGTTLDSSGMGNHGVNYNATSTAGKNGQPGTAYYFNGTSAKVAVPANASIQPSYRLSVAVWFQPDVKTLTGWGTVLTKRYLPATDPYNSYAISTYNNAKWSFGISNGTPGSHKALYTKATTPYNAAWIFMVCVYDSNSMKIYLNGVLDTTTTFSGALGYTTQDLTIGSTNTGPNDFYQGKIDDIKIFNRDLTPQEVIRLYLGNFTNNYFSKSSGPLDSLSTWGINPDGSGTNPPNFSQNNTGYYIYNNSNPVIGNNWLISGSNTAIVFGDGTNPVNVSIPATATVGGDSIYVRANVTLSVLGNMVSNKRGFEDGSTVQYVSPSAQLIPPASFFNLVVSGGTKTLTGTTTVRNTLAMISNIDCNGNAFNLGSSSTQTGTLTYGSGKIIGSFTRWFNANANTGTGSGLFPIGNTSQYYPILVEYAAATGSSGTLTASFNAINPGNSGLNPALYDFSIAPIVTVNKAAPNGYWSLTPSSGLNSSRSYTATVTANGFFGINNISGLRLVRRNNSASGWGLTGNAIAPTGSIASPVISRSGITVAGGEFGVGADSTVNPLPVSYLNISAKRTSENQVTLKWQTASEMNADRFEVERLINAGQDLESSWTSIGVVKAKGNSNQVSSYYFQDDLTQTNPGTLEQISYRLKQADLDGTVHYSNIVGLDLTDMMDNLLQAYPNPTEGNLSILNPDASCVQVRLLDINGTEVLTATMEGKSQRNFDIGHLSNGAYQLEVSGTSNHLSKRIILAR